MENYKVIILGSGGVGKSAITIQFVKNQFVAAYDPTIEDSHSKTFNVDGKDVSLEIIDTAGQDDFAEIRTTYMRNGQGFVIVFAVNDPASFDSVDKFQNDVKITSGKDNIPIVVCGNKCDQPNRDVTDDEAKQYCQDHGLTYFETSAKDNYNIQESFAEVVRMMRKQNPNIQPANSGGETKEKKTKESKDNSEKVEGKCCSIC